MEAIVLSDQVGAPLGLYDRHAEGQPSLMVLKAVDISAQCPGEKRVVMRYGRDTIGNFVQFDDGVTVHFHFDDITRMGLAHDFGFNARASRWGIETGKLLDLIFDNAPRH